VQARIETLRNREIPADDVDVCRQMCGVWISSHGAKAGACGHQLIDHVTSDVASGAGDEDSVQWLTSLVPPAIHQAAPVLQGRAGRTLSDWPDGMTQRAR
jgi:hypothetical protein